MRYTIQVPSQLSSHLKALRKAKGLSQAELGARLGLSQTRIARIEGDPLSISVGQLLRVLSVLGVQATLDLLSENSGSANLTLPTLTVSASGTVPPTPDINDEAW